LGLISGVKIKIFALLSSTSLPKAQKAEIGWFALYFVFIVSVLGCDAPNER
jgi:hypothetical protein